MRSIAGTYHEAQDAPLPQHFWSFLAMGSDDDLLPADIKKEVTKKVNFVRRQPKKGDEAPPELSMKDFFMRGLSWLVT